MRLNARVQDLSVKSRLMIKPDLDSGSRRVLCDALLLMIVLALAHAVHRFLIGLHEDAWAIPFSLKEQC